MKRSPMASRFAAGSITRVFLIQREGMGLKSVSFLLLFLLSPLCRQRDRMPTKEKENEE
jgi:hypothetical protein